MFGQLGCGFSSTNWQKEISGGLSIFGVVQIFEVKAAMYSKVNIHASIQSKPMRILNVLAHTLFFDELHHLKRKGKGNQESLARCNCYKANWKSPTCLFTFLPRKLYTPTGQKCCSRYTKECFHMLENQYWYCPKVRGGGLPKFVCTNVKEQLLCD